MLLTTLLSTGLFGGLWISSEYSAYQAESIAIREDLLTSYKEQLKTEVSKASSYIAYQKDHIEPRSREIVQSRVNEAHAIALNIFEQNRGKRSLAEIQDMVKDTLRSISFNNGRGYFFAFSLRGIEALNADKPEMEGKDMLPVQGAQGEYVVRDMLDIVKRSGEGFYKYTWTKPGLKGMFPKLAYVKLFESFGWVIGTGEYLDDIGSDVQKEVISYIEQIKYQNDGYIFAGRWDGESLSGPAKGKNMWDITDSNGKKLVQELIRLSKEGGGYFEYVMPKLESKKPAPKLSYVVGVPEWKWYVGTGIYIDEIETAIERNKQEFEQKIISHLIKIALVLAGLVAVVFFVAVALSRKTKKNLDSFLAFFKRATVELDEIDPDVMDFVELQDLAVSVNEMIGALKQAEVALMEQVEEQRQLRDQIIQQQKLESIGQLVGGIAHDFNNMLTPVFGYSEMIMSRVDPDDKIYGFAGSIIDAANKAKNMIQQLMCFSRNQTLVVQCNDLNEIVVSFMKMLASSIRENITIRMDLCSTPCLVQSNRVQIEQILLNLAVNAQDAISANGVITIETGHVVFDDEFCRSHLGVQAGNYVLLAFTDSGCGMNDEVLSHIFEPFFTTKSVGLGTGLGLSTVFGIIKQHNGFVDVQSSAGVGTTFRIYLQEDKDGVTENTQMLSEKTEPSRFAATILLAEDNRILLDFIQLLLEEQGYTVLAADFPENALVMARENEKIDLLISDVTMPQMSGPELYEHLLETRPELKVIFMSGYPGSVEISHGSLVESVDFIAKPFTSEVFLKKVSAVLSL